MSKNTINFREFLIDHLDNNYDAKDLYKMINTLNPANNRFKIKSEAVSVNSTHHKVDMKVMYKFPNEKSASLFSAVYKDLVQSSVNKENLVSLKLKSDTVLLELKEEVLVSHKEKDLQSVEAKKRMSNEVKKREVNRFLSDIFMTSVSSVMSSGLYQVGGNEVNRLQKKEISTVEELKDRENELSENKIVGSGNSSSLNLYKKVMLNNAIPKNTSLDKEILSQIEKGLDSQLNTKNGLILVDKLFRDYNVTSLDKMLETRSMRINNILNQQDIITQQTLNKPEGIRVKFKDVMDRLGFGNAQKTSQPIKSKPEKMRISYS